VAVKRSGRHRSRSALALAGAIIAAFLLGAIPTAAYANTTSTMGYPTVNGKTYRMYALLYIPYPNQAGAYTYNGPNSGSIAAGWAGANGRLFTSGGSLSCESGWGYSTSTITYPSFYGRRSCMRTQSGTWYSYGVTRHWNGDSYDNYYTYKTPYGSTS
jgi:hypothetical protein